MTDQPSSSPAPDSEQDGPSVPDADEPPEDPQGFKEKLDELDSILETLQTGDLELEESLELYEDSIGLLRECKEILNTSEEKIQMLRQEGKKLVTEPFEPEEEDEGSSSDGTSA